MLYGMEYIVYLMRFQANKDYISKIHSKAINIYNEVCFAVWSIVDSIQTLWGSLEAGV